MSGLHRRLLKLEAVDGRHVFRELSDSELDHCLRDELRTWLRDEPSACPPSVHAEVLAFLAADEEPAAPPSDGLRVALDVERQDGDSAP